MTSTLASIHQACTAQAQFSSPLGPLLLARTAAGLAGAWFDGQQHHPGPLDAPSAPADPLLRDAAAQLQGFFTGELRRFNLPLDLLGSAFQRRVWQALLRIEYAGTRCYGDIAGGLGEPAAARAVGAAVGRNPLSVIVPCHRVLGAGGALTGYAGGLDRKVALLKLERQSAHPADRLDTAEASA
jgi:methylated-DNA-[protein]-cysteine S-methyltransferase